MQCQGLMFLTGPICLLRTVSPEIKGLRALSRSKLCSSVEDSRRTSISFCRSTLVYKLSVFCAHDWRKYLQILKRPVKFHLLGIRIKGFQFMRWSIIIFMPEIPSRVKMQLLPSLTTLDVAMKIPERLQESRRNLIYQRNSSQQFNF